MRGCKWPGKDRERGNYWARDCLSIVARRRRFIPGGCTDACLLFAGFHARDGLLSSLADLVCAPQSFFPFHIDCTLNVVDDIIICHSLMSHHELQIVLQIYQQCPADKVVISWAIYDQAMIMIIWREWDMEKKGEEERSFQSRSMLVRWYNTTKSRINPAAPASTPRKAG